MTSRITLLIVFAAGAFAQGTGLDLARSLANRDTRAAAVAAIVKAGGRDLPLLLEWSRQESVGLFNRELRIGLADAFGELRAKEAIPWLIENITLERYNDMNTWTRADEVKPERLVAVAALIKIGEAASEPLMEAYWKPLTAEARLTVLYAIVRMNGSGSKDFLAGVRSIIAMETELIKEGAQR